MEAKFQRVKNKWYRQFLDQRTIEPLNETEFNKALSNVKGRYSAQGRALLITLYYTGCRPAEALDLQPECFKLDKGKVQVTIQTLKRGVPRTLPLNPKNKHIKELYSYATAMPPHSWIFHQYRGDYTRFCKKKDGTFYTRIERSQKVYNHFRKWFKDVREGGLPPYFLRHNLFSKLGQLGLTTRELAYVKGARRESSVEHYVHITPGQLDKIGKNLNKV